MSITTALGSIDHPGLRNWERQQVAAFAVAHAEEILAKDEEVAYRYLMAVPKFLTPEKADEIPPEVDVWNAAEYALNAAAETGSVGAMLTSPHSATSSGPSATTAASASSHSSL